MPRFAHHVVRRPLLAVALLVAAGCASGTSGGSSEGTTGAAPSRRRQADVITAEEIANTNASDALHAIELLRPTFLRSRGSSSAGRTLSPVVYVNGQRWGEPGMLRNLPANDVATVRRLSGAEAQSRYGLDNVGGVIDVTTKSGPKQ